MPRPSAFNPCAAWRVFFRPSAVSGRSASDTPAVPRATRWFFTHLGHGRDERYAFLLAAMLSCAVLAAVVGIEGIVGAFFAGLGLNRLIPAGSALMERVEFFGSALLVPVFLVSVGVLIKPAVVPTRRRWAWPRCSAWR